MLINNTIIIGGATASGKSKLGLKVASKLKDQLGIDSEIVNADGMQLYNELKILTAQPKPDELLLLPHNLYSILTPFEKISVYDWNKRAVEVIHKLEKKNKVAIVVGGTGFYINSLCYGQPTAPKVPDEIRIMTHSLFDKIGRDEFYEKLLLIDSRIQNTINKGDTQRLLRAYEVFEYTGKSIIDFWDGQEEKNPDILKVFLNPPKTEVLDNIQKRIDIMLKDNMLDEVLFYKEKYKNVESQLNHALGFKEFSMYLDGKISLDDATKLANIASAHYAKRQVTWFKNKMPNSVVIENISECSVNTILKKFTEIR